MKAGQNSADLGCPPRAGILLAAGIVCAVLAIQVVPDAAAALQWRRDGGAATGVLWLTAHLCHWSWNHLAWDVVVFSVLSLLCLRLRPSRYVLCLVVAALCIPVEIRWNQPVLETYRGLSGLDSALMGLVVAGLWRGGGGRPNTARVLAVMGGAGFLAKVLWEMLSGSTLFVSGAHGAFVPAFSAHLVGFLSGLVVGLWGVVMRSSRLHAWSGKRG